MIEASSSFSRGVEGSRDHHEVVIARILDACDALKIGNDEKGKRSSRSLDVTVFQEMDNLSNHWIFEKKRCSKHELNSSMARNMRCRKSPATCRTKESACCFKAGTARCAERQCFFILTDDRFARKADRRENDIKDRIDEFAKSPHKNPPRKYHEPRYWQISPSAAKRSRWRIRSDPLRRMRQRQRGNLPYPLRVAALCSPRGVALSSTYRRGYAFLGAPCGSKQKARNASSWYFRGGFMLLL